MWCALILVRHSSHPPLPKISFFAACNMSDRIQSSRIEALFESALHDYENQTGIPLAKHPLAEQLQNCQSVDSVTTLLQERARAFNEYRGSDKIMKSLRSIVSALSRVSATTVGQNICMVCPRQLIRCSTSLTPIHSRSHLRMLYIQASVSCSLYVPPLFHLRILVTI